VGWRAGKKGAVGGRARLNTLTAGLDAALSESSEALREKGAKGRRWMERDFSWLSVG